MTRLFPAPLDPPVPAPQPTAAAWPCQLAAYVQVLLRRRWRFVAVFCLTFALIGAELASAYQTTVSNQAADTAVERSEVVLRLASEAMAEISDMQVGYRGFLLTGDEASLPTYDAGRQAYPDLLRKLEQRTAEDPTQLARWQAIERLANDWQTQIAEPMVEHRRSLGASQLDQLAYVTATRLETQRFEQIHGTFREALASEQSLLGERRHLQADADARLLAVLIWGTAAATLLSLLLGGWILFHLERERLAGVWLTIQTSEHELYNRLSAARGNIELLLREPDLPAHQQRWAERAHRGVIGATDVVRTMRQLRQVRPRHWSAESGVSTLDLTP